jgi:hypothetical protein
MLGDVTENNMHTTALINMQDFTATTDTVRKAA